MSKVGRNVEDILKDAGFDFLTADASPNVVEGALRNLAHLLEDADDIRRAVVREAAIRHLPGCGVKSPAGLVGAALVRPSSNDEDSAQGHAILFQELEPWPEPVDGAGLLRELAALFRRFLVLPPGAGETLALWTLHTYGLDATEISPILALVSPEKRCGKTLTLEILGLLVNRPVPASNITPATLFRAVEKFQPTLLIDEMDSFGGDELRGILNSGHRRSGAFVIRTVGDDFEPRIFSTWCPKALALIGALPGTLEDRAVIINMKRKAPGECLERFRRGLIVLQAETIRRKARGWIDDNLAALRAADPALPAGLNDRAADNWEPLLAIADLASGDWPQQAREAARVLAGTVNEGENSAAIQLLSDVRDLFVARGADRLSSEHIVSELEGMEDRPWPELKHGRPLTKRQLARLLDRFKVHPKQLRIGGSKCRGYELGDLQDTFRRYLPSHEVVQGVQPNAGAGLSPFEETVQDDGCTVSKFPVSHCKESLVPLVPDETGDSWREEAFEV